MHQTLNGLKGRLFLDKRIKGFVVNNKICFSQLYTDSQIHLSYLRATFQSLISISTINSTFLIFSASLSAFVAIFSASEELSAYFIALAFIVFYTVMLFVYLPKKI